MLVINLNDEIEILESTPSKIRYKNIVWIPENKTNRIETNSLSSEKIRIWLRIKNIKVFTINDVREAFPEWGRYAKSQIIFKVNPLIKNKIVQQLPNDNFKVLKL